MKSEKTYELEEIIALATWKIGRYGCPEVGFGDDGIVDYISIELGGKRIVRCYELKISKSDFLSNAKKTFIGEYNYYVIPTELWTSVKNYIEPGVGCWCIDKNGNAEIMKRASYRKCKLKKNYILTRIFQALARENLKYVEKSWELRQKDKSVKDFNGGSLKIGDIVEWKELKWFVTDIEYHRSATTLIPECVITPYKREGNTVNVRPSILRKINNIYD